jgi:hypothetical protein
MRLLRHRVGCGFMLTADRAVPMELRVAAVELSL